MNIKRIGITLCTVIVAIFSLASCASDYATSTSDSHICVFDGSERGGQKLKFQVAPGAESKKIDDNDQVVKIPASNRFYATVKNDARRDPLASSFYTANAKGSVPVQIEGQIRFRFNLKLACEWYSKHGRRNADENGNLGFNARGADALQAGWFRFLTENFGQTMDQSVVPLALNYDWKSLVYNYPVNADENGIVPTGETQGIPTREEFGRAAADEFTKRLNKNLGGDYFCGVEEDSEDDCPPMSFEVTNITGPQELMDSQSKLETTRQELANQEQEATLREKQQAATMAAERNKQEELKARLETARIQAQIDTARCAAIVAVNPNLDCEGKAPAVVVGR